MKEAEYGPSGVKAGGPGGGAAGENKEDTTQNEKKKKGGTAKITSTSRGSKAPVLSPEVEKVVEKFVKHATESGIEALRAESRELLDLRPTPDAYKTFSSMSDRNRFPEIQCIDETRIILEQNEPNTNTYIHANRVKLDRVKEVAMEIRKQRAHAISNELQYFFIYSTVLDYIRWAEIKEMKAEIVAEAT
ncbi:hypothetical protein TELCIR_12107 [Teladorsagia circumcincta]|uniref:Tyrosine-protein phosphatase domain-containing protein n=1 Tax=Teladorsagia circumcincta TaxID=45464 RepID=A0A2G9U7L8_TELCI|nr:hypothetical protein TELCIR_12107 [Teladorsagia circumcincta]